MANEMEGDTELSQSLNPVGFEGDAGNRVPCSATQTKEYKGRFPGQDYDLAIENPTFVSFALGDFKPILNNTSSYPSLGTGVFNPSLNSGFGNGLDDNNYTLFGASGSNVVFDSSRLGNALDDSNYTSFESAFGNAVFEPAGHGNFFDGSDQTSPDPSLGNVTFDSAATTGLSSGNTYGNHGLNSFDEFGYLRMDAGYEQPPAPPMTFGDVQVDGAASDPFEYGQYPSWNNNTSLQSTTFPSPAPTLVQGPTAAQAPLQPQAQAPVQAPPPARAHHPHRCNTGPCTKSFKRHSDLARHRSAVHGNARGHLCPIPGCDKSQGRGYSRADKVTEHLWKKHGNLGYRKA